MPFAPEVESWISELGLTPEERKVFDPFLDKPERIEKVKGSVLRQSEFSKKMQALDKQKAELEAAVAEKERIVAEDAASLGTWKQTADKTLADNQKALEDAKTKAFRLEERMKSLATQYGVDPKELGLDGEPKPPETKPSLVPDASEFDKRYLARGDADKLLAEVKSSPFIAAELEDIVDEHRTLFGKGVNRRELVSNALKNKRTLREEWETSNEVAKRRDELKEKEIEERINAKVAEERTKILSEHKLPVTRGAESGSPILGMRDDLKLAGTDRSKVTGAGAVDAAVAAYNTGKYRNAPPTTQETGKA
jgi:hypothetical protein